MAEDGAAETQQLPRGYRLETAECPLPDPDSWAAEVVPLLCSGEFGANFGKTW